MKFAKISCIRCGFMIYLHLRRRGETGRRAGLKILWTNHPCRFESDRRHQRKNNLAKTVRLFFHISAPSRLRVRARIYEKIKCVALARLLLSARRRYSIPPRCATPKVFNTATVCYTKGITIPPRCATPKVLLYRHCVPQQGIIISPANIYCVDSPKFCLYKWRRRCTIVL